MLAHSSTHMAMTKPEAKLVAVFKCAFFIEDHQISKLLRLLWGEKRVRELIGVQDHEPAGEDLVLAAEDALSLSPGELEDLTLEECECKDCQYKTFYLTTESDIGKKCTKCQHENSVFLPAVDDNLIDP